jgi:RNA polymerase sigma-70 factor (ECF subfamily)
MANGRRKEKFTDSVLENISALNRFAYSLCQDASETEELVSETVVKAFEKFDSLKDAGKLKQWLFKILRNQFISNYRKSKRIVGLSDYQFASDDGEESFSLYEAINVAGFENEGNPERQFISKITQEQIKSAIDQLPAEFRIALSLCDIEDFSYAEISQILKVPIGTVRSRIARARTILQKKLWMYAEELGITSAPPKKEKGDYVCTCGKEEPHVHHSNTTN